MVRSPKANFPTTSRYRARQESDAPGPPAVRCRHGGRALRTRDRSSIIYAVGYARDGGRAVTEHSRVLRQSQHTTSRQVVRRVGRVSRVRVHKGRVNEASLPSVSWLLHISTDRKVGHDLLRFAIKCDLHLRNLDALPVRCQFDSSTVTRDGGRGTDTRLML